MAQSVQDVQRTSILRMLDLGQATPWKVMVYDKFCQEVIAPLLKVGSLRNHGVTLHLSLNNDRLPVEVPAVYFVEPTEDSIQKICEDLGKSLYMSCYINFSSAVTRGLLEKLARGAMEANAAQKIAGVFDRYVSFVSLSPSLFSLNLPCAYETLHSPSITDQIVLQYVERIVDGLLSMLITLKALPVIRCPAGDVAERVGRRLEERLRELLSRGELTDIFSAVAGGTRASDNGPRPVLCVLDRDMDLVTMVHHTWTYQALVQDVLGLRLNKLSVPVDDDPNKFKSYDVDETDAFWAAHARDDFPDVTKAVGETVDEFNKKRAAMAATEVTDGSHATDLASAISALPEMTEKKRSLDMHTNIATALMDAIKSRQLDKFYCVEDEFGSQSLSTAISQLEELLKDPHGTCVDKTRAAMVLYLSKSSISASQFAGIVEALNSCGGDAAGLVYLQHLSSVRNMSLPSFAPTAPSSGGSLGGTASSMFGGLAGKMQGVAAGMSNMMNIASKRELLICQILEGLMEQKTTGVVENYLYLDPKSSASEAPRMRAPFQRAIAFVVGGGNYVELQSLQEWAQTHKRSVIYGSTDMVSPTQFVDELSQLGK